MFIGIGGSGVYFLAKTIPGAIGLPKNAAEKQAEVDGLISKVGDLIALPAGEKPTIATITNIDQLKGQPFFANTKNGDQLLIYEKANKAIIYRPSENKVIEVGSVNATQSPTPSPTATPSTVEQKK